jgi:hypothetical protein
MGELFGHGPELLAKVGVEDRGGPVGALASAVEVLAGDALYLW